MFRFVAVIGTVMALLGPSTADIPGVADAPIVSLQLQSALGTGCPAGTTKVVPVDEKYALGVNYSDFEVSGNDYTNCQLVIEVTLSAGFTYAAYAVNHGYASLSPERLAIVKTTSYLTGSPVTADVTRTFHGLYRGFWTASSYDGTLDWAPCNTDRLLNINNTIRVDGAPTDFMSMKRRSAGMQASTVVHVQWRKC